MISFVLDGDSNDNSNLTEEERHQLALQKANATKQFLLTLVDRNRESGPGAKLQYDTDKTV